MLFIITLGTIVRLGNRVAGEVWPARCGRGAQPWAGCGLPTEPGEVWPARCENSFVVDYRFVTHYNDA